MKVKKYGLAQSSSKDIGTIGGVSSSVHQEIAAQDSERQLSFAGDTPDNNFQTFMVSSANT